MVLKFHNPSVSNVANLGDINISLLSNSSKCKKNQRENLTTNQYSGRSRRPTTHHHINKSNHT